MSSLNVFCEDWTTMGNLTVTTINSMGVSFAVASVYTLAVMAHPVMVSRGLETPSFEMKVNR